MNQQKTVYKSFFHCRGYCWCPWGFVDLLAWP